MEINEILLNERYREYSMKEHDKEVLRNGERMLKDYKE